MGLQKTIESSHGVNSDYWRVDCIKYLDHRAKIAMVEMFGFPDKATSDSGKQPLGKVTMRITGDEFDAMIASPVTDSRDWIYSAIIARNETLAVETQALQDQIDVIEMIPEGDRTEEQISILVDLEYQKSALAEDTIRYIFDGAVNVIEE